MPKQQECFFIYFVYCCILAYGKCSVSIVDKNHLKTKFAGIKYSQDIYQAKNLEPGYTKNSVRRKQTHWGKKKKQRSRYFIKGFTEENKQVTNTHMKRRSALLVSQGTTNKTTGRYTTHQLEKASASEIRNNWNSQTLLVGGYTAQLLRKTLQRYF